MVGKSRTDMLEVTMKNNLFRKINKTRLTMMLTKRQK